VFIKLLFIIIIVVFVASVETAKKQLTIHYQVCSVIVQSCYKTCHDAVAQIIHWELARKGNLNIDANWWDHHPVPAMQNSNLKLLWDFTIQTGRHLVHNRPDIVCVDLL